MSRAGAFLLPEGQGQFIAGVGYSEGVRRFDKSGTPVPAAVFRKANLGGYLEYGFTSYLSFIAAPTLARQNGSFATNSVTGSDSSAFGARLQLYGRPGTVVAVQALVQPPTGNSDSISALSGGAQTLATDFRLLLGQAFQLFGRPAFIDIQPGARVRTEPFPNEARLDLTFGVRPIASFLLLVQSFSAFPPSRGPLVERSSYTKAQASAVYDISPRWSVQAGAFRTITGRNAVRETGPLVAVWYRF